MRCVVAAPLRSGAATDGPKPVRQRHARARPTAERLAERSGDVRARAVEFSSPQRVMQLRAPRTVSAR